MKDNMRSILKDIFDDFDVFTDTRKPLHPNHGTPVDIITNPCCHNDDQEPMTIIWPDKERGPWIAGGACLRWYQGQPVGENDIDVFCASAEQAKTIIDNIKSYGRYSTKYESDNATTLSYYDKQNTKYWTIQIIKRRYFKTLQEVIDNFDISVCQIGTGGQEWLLGKNTARDIRERNLRMNVPLQPDAAKRLAKYWTYGYRPVDGLVPAVQNNPVAKQMFQSNEDYENAF
jgi:hypothetical protein